ncbi:unnamed protein product [Lampetra planeri]
MAPASAFLSKQVLRRMASVACRRAAGKNRRIPSPQPRAPIPIWEQMLQRPRTRGNALRFEERRFGERSRDPCTGGDLSEGDAPASRPSGAHNGKTS